MQLVELIHLCMQIEITTAEVQKVREGFIKWVERYEKWVALSSSLSSFRAYNTHRMYYQYLPSRLPACPLTIHALLHIADSIEATGPMWVSWAFPTERYCGSLLPAVKSRRFPFPSIDRYITELAQLSQIKLMHNLHDKLSLRVPTHGVVGQFCDAACESFSLNISCKSH
jgi:hypothetical protein